MNSSITKNRLSVEPQSVATGLQSRLKNALPGKFKREMQRVKQSIMILSDDRYRSGRLRGCLEEAGYQVEVCERGKTGLSTIKARCPDLAMLDWDLPDLSGLAMTRMLRADLQMADLPIIMLGWNLSEGDRILALEAGADFCLTETPHPQVLVARVRALLRRVALPQ